MYCQKCGAEIPDGNRFCQSCGAPAEPFAPPTQQAQQPQQPQPGFDPNFGGQNSYQAPPPYQNGGYSYAGQPHFYDCGIQRREIATAIILSIVTCGIYNIYWFIKQVDDVNRAANDQTSFSGVVTFLLGLVTGGIYTLYWYYQAGKKIRYAQKVRGMIEKENLEILYLVLGFFSAGIISMALIQNELNLMASPDNA
ncbi:MAG: DUF4234 domain-containing protein [Clostridiales bacterium]|nr:DUF4234 domain-containing protein [Clostridiales bacterium]